MSFEKGKSEIDIINKEKINKFILIITGLAVFLMVGFIFYTFKPFGFLKYIDNKEKVFEIILIFPVVLFSLIIHELTHISMYILFGKGQAKIKVRIDKEYGALIMHQINEDVFYSRNQMVAILLTPLIVINVVLSILVNFINAPFLLFFNILLNTVGSSIDLYVSTLLILNYKSSAKVNFHPDKVEMYVCH